LCPWTAAYKLVFVRGQDFGGSESIPLPGDVAPNQTVDIALNLKAPAAPGEYQGFWQLQTPNGTNFGIGSSAVGNLWVKIRAIGPALATKTATPAPSSTATVPAAGAETRATSSAGAPPLVASSTATSIALPTSAPSLTMDLTGSACNAEWQANDGILDCPGKDGEARGFVLKLNQAKLEDGSTVSIPTLLTFPSSSKDGYILGLYPQYAVDNGDHFQASVGCEGNALSCSVLFRLSYLDSSGAAHDLWSLGEFYDGKYFNLDADLSALAGQQIRLVLSVNGLGSPAGDRALWVGPRIVHYETGAPVASNTPTVLPPTAAATARSTITPTATAAAVAPAKATPTPGPQNPTPSISQILQSVISFFSHLFSGK
jgi:hypothetical protein